MYDRNQQPAISKVKVTTRTQKTRLQCMECGHKFAKTLKTRTTSVRCPNCFGYDVEPA